MSPYLWLPGILTYSSNLSEISLNPGRQGIGVTVQHWLLCLNILITIAGYQGNPLWELLHNARVWELVREHKYIWMEDQILQRTGNFYWWGGNGVLWGSRPPPQKFCVERQVAPFHHFFVFLIHLSSIPHAAPTNWISANNNAKVYVSSHRLA